MTTTAYLKKYQKNINFMKTNAYCTVLEKKIGAPNLNPNFARLSSVSSYFLAVCSLLYCAVVNCTVLYCTVLVLTCSPK